MCDKMAKGPERALYAIHTLKLFYYWFVWYKERVPAVLFCLKRKEVRMQAIEARLEKWWKGDFRLPVISVVVSLILVGAFYAI